MSKVIIAKAYNSTTDRMVMASFKVFRFRKINRARFHEIILKSGFGIALNGDGINVPFDTRFSVSLPKRGGKYALWLVRHEVRARRPPSTV